MKVRTLLVLLICVLSYSVYGQCESITAKSVSTYTPFSLDSLYEADGLRNGDDYDGATLYFPTNSESNLKSIVLVPGYKATQRSVSLWARYLAERGYVTMTIGTNALTDSPALRAKALVDGMETIRQENNRTDSPLFQKLDTENIAVGGWSMGGGGAQLAAALDKRVKAVIAITPWLYPKTLAETDLNHTAPVLILSGQVDPTAPPASHSNVHYEYTPSNTKKMLFEITEGNHSTPLYPNTGNGDLGNVAYAWLELFVRGNDCYSQLLSTNALNQNSTASKQQSNLN
ncbi:dienelactone hydrolase family protein [Roseivirga ehrenbergii]|uniref:Triacylglycerol lipase n=1 Tax=Roseivirga ehrenbergii (strain DSM 102268 / JCM 13514 / KCTC 12282 / NCIMB 14502 / KMM 6017) TaxID=279360 RepID=A0A150X819_ROSEK|nr:dienelactone hydrolase family protein [Roseivirga ehrenbergii]KYG74868.1 triacylglycerol lipase [Roseivirga ehrenbergii]TCL13794.1 dienelactone hydrolase family protein [Roseivirga ehrenbergii]